MKIFFNLVLLGLMAAVAITIYRTPYSPCNKPLTYTIGSVDQRFGLPTDTVLSYAQQAADIWNSGDGRTLFLNTTSKADLTINFVYDQRTALNQNVEHLQNQVNQENQSLKGQVDNFNADAAAFEQKLSDFNATVQRYNSQGGAPPEVYRSLIEQQNQLRAEGNSLNQRARQLNLNSQDFNSQVQDLNQNIDAFNQALSQQPEEGLYDGLHQSITIYFASSKDEFVHTLAHEFGHAIGMNHVQNDKAIMYTYSTANLDVTPDDKNELSRACQYIPLPLYWLHALREQIARYLLLNPASN